MTSTTASAHADRPPLATHRDDGILTVVRAALGVLAAQAALTVVAVLADWRTCFEKAAAHLPVSSAFAAHGSAISAPVMPLVVLAIAAVLASRTGRLRVVGLVGVCLVALAIAFGAVGEALSSSSAFTPRAVLVFTLLAGLTQAATLVAAVRAGLRTR